jgi:hypothetical protein
MKKTVYMVLLLIIAVLVIGTIILYIQRGDNYIEFSQTLSAFATVIVALLTAAYVLTTNNQLSVMEKQLEEMSKGRELENQPLPWIENPIFIIEKPRAFYSPPHNMATIQSIYRIEYKIKNIGKGAAVGIYFDPKFIVEFDSTKYQDDCPPRKIEVIEEGKYYEYEKPWYEDCNMVVFTSDCEYLAFKSLVKSRVLDLPTLDLVIYYRNFIGAAFKIDCRYKVMRSLTFNKPNDELSICKEWLSILTDSSVKFSDELKQVELTYPIDRDEGRRKFKAIETDFKTMLKDSCPEEIRFPVFLVAEDYTLSTITREEYNLKIEELLKDDLRRRYS